MYKSFLRAHYISIDINTCKRYFSSLKLSRQYYALASPLHKKTYELSIDHEFFNQENICNLYSLPYIYFHSIYLSVILLFFLLKSHRLNHQRVPKFI
jgi:hypothetical protein